MYKKCKLRFSTSTVVFNGNEIIENINNGIGIFNPVSIQTVQSILFVAFG